MLGHAGETAIDPIEGRFAAGIDEEAVDEVGEFVARRSVDAPRGTQSLVTRENFLDDDVERLPECLGPFDQKISVRAGICKAVDMIDPQTLEHAPFDQAEDEAMCLRERLTPFHPQPGKLVDIEEPTVVDVIDRNAPKSKSIGLPAE